jgi:hypothetical protein
MHRLAHKSTCKYSLLSSRREFIAKKTLYSYYDTKCKNYAGTRYSRDNVVGGPYGSQSMLFVTRVPCDGAFASTSQDYFLQVLQNANFVKQVVNYFAKIRDVSGPAVLMKQLLVSASLSRMEFGLLVCVMTVHDHYKPHQ